MKYKGRRGSTNVEDRRGMGSKTLVGGGLGGIVIILVVMLMGGNPGELFDGLMNTSTVENTPYTETEQEKELSEFVSVVLADTEDVWSEIFRQEGLTYEEPKLVLYSGSVQSACGAASAAVGPFYCPGDQKLYIDLSFYQELKDKFKAPGDFAMAYVIAHEVGHHVQTLIGTSEKVNALRSQLSAEQFNKYSVRLELQADYYAGVWSHHAQGMNLLEEGDLEEALNAASAIGDDTIQKRAQGYVVPESFTHGTSEQRKTWFYKGFKSGTIKEGNTFEGMDI